MTEVDLNGAISTREVMTMLAGSEKLKKLREKSLVELNDRGRQAISKLRERLFGHSVGEMTDRSLLRHIKETARAKSPEETALGVVNRMRDSQWVSRHSSRHTFFPSICYREEVVSTMERRFKRERQAIIERAQRAIEGRFDLLGFADLGFGDPPDWLLEPISGRRAPLAHWSRIDYLDQSVAGDKKITWELNRLQHFVTLGQAYWMTWDERYARAFVAQATSWMDANPPNRGINWASSLELAFRSIAWLWALHLFAGSPHISSGFALRSLKHLIAHGQHIESYLSRYFSPNTHLTGEALGLVYLGTALNEVTLAKTWRNLGVEILLDELSRQIRSDGVYFEQSTYYHRYVADFYIHLVLLARASGIELTGAVEERLEQLLTHLMWITRPDGTSPLIGDDDGGRLIIFGPRSPDDFRDTLAAGAAIFGRADWKHTAGQAVETLWLLGPQGLAAFDEIQSEASKESARVFNASGYSVMRDGWSQDSSYLLMDCGPHGSLACGHAHADALSIEFAAGGKTWIVDPGTFTYTSDPELRNHFRSTEAHNTVVVDREPQSVPGGAFSWRHVAQARLDDFIFEDGFDFVEGSHDGYERLADPVRHTRAIINPKPSAHDAPFASPLSYLVVRDTFTAAARHDYQIRYHLAPGCSALASGNRVIVTEPDGARATIAVFGHSILRAEIAQGWVSRAYGKMESAPVAIFSAEGEGPQHFTTIIIPPCDQAIRVEQREVNYPGAQAFQLVSGEVRDLLVLSDGKGLIECGPIAVEGSVAWVRSEGNEFSRAFLVRGRLLETSSAFSFRSAESVHHVAIRRTEMGIEGSVDGEAPFDLALGEQTNEVAVIETSFECLKSFVVPPSGGNNSLNYRFPPKGGTTKQPSHRFPWEGATTKQRLFTHSRGD